MDHHMQIANSAFATRCNYLRGLKSLILHYQKLPEECTADEVKTYLVHERDKCNLSSSTINLRVCSLKYYFRHVAGRLDLVVKIPNPRIQKYDTEVLSYQELTLLFSCCRDMRQKLIMTALFDTGLRVRELLRLRLSDFDKQHQSIIIRNSKGNKTRIVYYGSRLRVVLKQYCKALGYLPKDYLIESYKDPAKALTLRGVQWIVKEAVKRSGLKKRIHPHTLRHSFAVHYLNEGGSIFALQRLLGHENITTTLHYLKYASLPEGKQISVLDAMP